MGHLGFGCRGEGACYRHPGAGLHPDADYEDLNMPVEIKELIIRAVAERDTERSARAPGLPMAGEEKDALVNACVRQVLRILKRSKER